MYRRGFLKHLLMLAVLGVFTYAYREPLAVNSAWLLRTYLPCSRPILYTVASFDERFGIAKEDLVSALLEAEAMWEAPVGKELFTQSPDGRLRINLIYDHRQAATEKLRSLGLTIDDSRSSYDALHENYASLHASYESKRSAYDAAVSAFTEKEDVYNKEVARLNAKGGAKRADYDRLTALQASFEADIAEIRRMEDELNAMIEQLNTLVVVLNRQASSLNLNVEAYNEVGEARGREFDEGIYRVASDEEAIDIFQFDSRTKLVQVLAHELGHALGLDHLDDPEAIMYRLNQGENKSLSAYDLAALRAHCRIAP